MSIIKIDQFCQTPPLFYLTLHPVFESIMKKVWRFYEVFNLAQKKDLLRMYRIKSNDIIGV